MGTKKRTKPQRQHDLDFVAPLYLKGYSLRSIAAKLADATGRKHCHETIRNDVMALLAEWREARIEDMDAAKTAELARINQLEQTYWDAWVRSQDETTKTTQEQRKGKGENSQRAVIAKEERIGDPRFLDGVAKCITMRCKILGVDAPQKHELTGANGGPLAYQDMSDAQLAALLATHIAAGGKLQENKG